jgi:hypothetical protein
MKISKTPSALALSKKKAQKIEATDKTAFANHIVDTNKIAEDFVPVADVGGITSVGSIIAAQEVNEDGGRKSRQIVKKYGQDILDRLDEVQRDLLIGVIPKDRLTNLAQILRSKKNKINDPLLQSLINDIELRAQIELAKYTRKT